MATSPAESSRRRRTRKRGGRGRRRGGSKTPAAATVVQEAEPTAPEPEHLPEDVPEPAPTSVAHKATEEPPSGGPEQGFTTAIEPALGEPVTSAPGGAAIHAYPAGRKTKGAVVLAIGLPGSGKSSWFRRRGVNPLSSDMLRTILFDDITQQRYQDLVFSTLRSLLRARLIARMPWNYVDATNLSPKERRGWIKMAQEFGYEVHAVFFDVPLEVCQERNLRRQRVVPEDVMQRMASKLRPPTFEEGFTKITVVRVKPKPAE